MIESCNECNCSPNGTILHCLNTGCTGNGIGIHRPISFCYIYFNETSIWPEPMINKTICTPDCAVWYDGCNNCQCNDDMTLGACTKRMCFVHNNPYCL